jgi:hypothetical protein
MAEIYSHSNTENPAGTPRVVDDEEGKAGERFLSLAKRLVAVPKEEVDRLRHVTGSPTTT